MAEYTYLAYDLRLNTAIADIPLTGVGFGQKLNTYGGLSGSVPITDLGAYTSGGYGTGRYGAGTYGVGDTSGSAKHLHAKLLEIIHSATEPNKTAIFVDRAGVLVWGGIVSARRYRASSKSYEISALELFSYFHRRNLRQDISFTNQTAADQFDIARTLIDLAQAEQGGHIGVGTDWTVASGVVRERQVSAFERKNIGELVEQLAAVDNGFDFAVDVSYGPGQVPVKQLTLSCPFRGARAGQTGLMFEHPGNILDYTWPEDGTRQATRVDALGAGDGANMLVSTVSDTSLIDFGYPILDDAVSYKDVEIQATLDAHARADLDALRLPVTLPEITVRGDLDPVVGSYRCGDECRVRIRDDRFPSGLDTFMRITAIDVRPQSSNQAEEATLTLGPPAPGAVVL